MEQPPQSGAPEENLETGDTPATSDHTRPARLERIEEGRWIAGVSTGIAYYFNIPVWLVRVAFLLMMTAGGLGLVMYLAGALLIPHETEDQSMVMRWADQLERPSQWIGAALAVLGVSILLGIFTDIGGGLIWVIGLIGLGVMLFRNDPADASPRKTVTETTDETAESEAATSAALVGAASSPKARRVREPQERKMREPKERKVRPPRPHSNLGRYTVATALLVLSALGTADILDLMTPSALDYFAVGLGITGLGLVIGTVWGRSRGLILVGLLLTPIVFVGSFVEPNIEGFDGQWRIGSADQWSEWTVVDHKTDTQLIDITELSDVHTFDANAGSFLIDLTDTVIDAGATLKVELGAGELLIIVPDDVRVQANGRVIAGDVTVFGENSSGLGFIEVNETAGPSGTVELFIDVEVGAGEIIIKQG